MGFLLCQTDQVGDRYNHRHSSYLYSIYPELEINSVETPGLYEASKRAVELRVKSGMGDKSAHAVIHRAFFAARLKDTKTVWSMLDFFVKNKFLSRSLVSFHFANNEVYNLDATLSLPSVIMEMLAYTKPGMKNLSSELPRVSER